MAEQDRHTSDGELPADGAQSSSTVAAEEEGVDGEIDETEEAEEKPVGENSMSRGKNSSRDIDIKNKDAERHHTSSDHRRHHHISGHRDRRRRPSGRGGMFDHEGRSNIGRLKQRPENLDELFNTSAVNVSSRFNGRKHDTGRGNHPRRSKQSFEDSSEGWELPGSNEDLVTHTKEINASTKLMKENRDLHRVQLKGLADKGEAEDGEILEDGELSDDGHVLDKHGDDASRDTIEVLTSKLTTRGKSKDKPERKKSDHKGKRNHEIDVKRKKRKNAGTDNLEGETNPAPAWGSGYQGIKKRVPEFCNREQRFSTGTKGYQSPPGLYDSPSYSEHSDDELISKAIMAEGYIDASVAADEKEGIFNHKVSSAKKTKRHFERIDYKRGRNSEKFEGPPKKKPFNDMTMSKRPACRFYLEGKCAKGSMCQFNHDVEKPKKMEVCKYHLTVKGCIREKCPYMHNYPCKYYHTGAKCYSGDKCKFSHDPLTEETRRALEMRVAAEDIVDMEDPDYNYFYDRSRDTQNKPSLLGSPPRFRPHGKKIPSLFEIEVHPPGQASKASPQTNRPSGFYNETNASTNPGMELDNAGGAVNSPNMGIISVTSGQGGQHGFSNQATVGSPGLLQVSARPNMMNIPSGNGRPMMMMANQQGVNLQQQRLAGGTSIQFLGPAQMNNNNQQPQSVNNLPPVLNMLGAIIREAAMQKGSVVHSNHINMMPNIGMGHSSFQHNTNNAVPSMNHINNIGPNNMQQENMNMSPNNSIVHNSIASSNANNFGPMNICLNIMGSNSSMGNLGLSSSIGNISHNNINNTDLNSKCNMESSGILGCMMGSSLNIAVSQQNMKQVTSIDVDYKIKQNIEEIKEESQDILELDKIRQEIQAQIDREDEGDCGIPENTIENIKEEQLTPERSHDAHEDDYLRENKDDEETEAEHIDIPSHLPKKQKELFKRIQQQQLLREKEWERQESLKAAHENEAKDDWYSSDEDEQCEKKLKLTDVLKKLNKESSTAVPLTSSFTLGSLNNSTSEMTTPSSASTFNIMQMINTIKSQSATSTDISSSKLTSETVGISLSHPSTKLGESQDSHQLKIVSSSPHPVFNSFTEALDTWKPSLRLPVLTVDPPVVSAVPMKNLAYSVIKISLSMTKPYTHLPDTVYAPDPAFKDDPRVKWHLNYLEKVSKELQRKESSDEERPQKQSDPRLKRKAADPRLAQTGDSPISIRGVESLASDLSLHRAQVSVDTRLVRLATGNLDPRLNRQNNNDAINLLNNVGGVPIIGMMGNQMAGSFNLLNSPMRGDIESVSYMESSTNNTSGLVNSLVSGGVNIMNMDGSGRLMQSRGGPMNNTGQIGNTMSMMRGQGNQLGSVPDLLNRMKGLQETGNILGDLGVMSFQGNSMMRGQQNPLRSDCTYLEPRMNSSSDPRLRSKKLQSEAHGSSDPRLKNRAITTREQQLNMKELVGMDPGSVIVNSAKDNVFSEIGAYDSNEFRSFPSKMKGQGNLCQSQNYLQSDAATFSAEQFNISQTRDSWASNTDHKIEIDKQLLSSSFAPLSVPCSNTHEKTAPKFDYRNDPRFKRINKLMSQQKFNIDERSPTGKDRQIDDEVGETNGQCDQSHSNYNISRTSDRDPRSRNACSPQLPDRLEDFDLPSSPMLTVVEPEPDIKVKDLFKAIDPTASPFC